MAASAKLRLNERLPAAEVPARPPPMPPVPREALARSKAEVAQEGQAALLQEFASERRAGSIQAEADALQKIFARFDADGDGKLSKDEYKAYLRGIAAWGTGSYTDEKWDESWPEECQGFESDTEGIALEAFESILYGKYRAGKAQADLDACKQARAD